MKEVVIIDSGIVIKEELILHSLQGAEKKQWKALIESE
jgi:hypothetical protein